MEKQRTLAGTAAFSGISLHTGARASVCLHPAPEDTGIVFRRVDLPGKPEVRALASFVVDVRRGTTISNGRATVFTVEHIMSALHAHNIDNAYVDMDGMEPPIADGSALPYIDMIARAGVEEQDAEAKIFVCDRLMHVDGGATQLFLAPSDTLKISCTTSFKGCPFDPQFLSLEITPESYDNEIAGGRTFVNYEDLQQLLAMGLVKGGSLDAAAIINDGAIICKDGLRFSNEIVRHKILDIVGDLFLCGRRVRANVVAIKPGHPRNVEMAGQIQKYLAQKEGANL